MQLDAQKRRLAGEDVGLMSLPKPWRRQEGANGAAAFFVVYSTAIPAPDIILFQPYTSDASSLLKGVSARPGRVSGVPGLPIRHVSPDRSKLGRLQTLPTIRPVRDYRGGARGGDKFWWEMGNGE